jgi:HlyD family secretion protein
LTRRLLALMVLAAAFVLLGACRDQQQAIAADVAKLDIKAAVAPPQTATVSAPIDGRIATLGIREGAMVKAGDILLSLANPTIERDLAYARAQVALAEYRLRHVGRASARPESLKILETRKAKLDRYKTLYATHDVSLDELENAEAEYAAAQRDAVAGAPVDDPALLRLDLEKAKAEEALVADRKERLIVAAPIGGVITRLLVNPGDNVFPRDPMLEIANAETLDVRGSIAPELQRYIHSGMPAEVKVFTVPPRRFVANIRTIVPATDSAGPTLVVPVPNPDGVLQPGMPAVITVR